jgi:hypothetical protein
MEPKPINRHGRGSNLYFRVPEGGSREFNPIHPDSASATTFHVRYVYLPRRISDRQGTLGVLMSFVLEAPSQVAMGERELRRQIDRSLSRALVDEQFCKTLLADPTVALDNRGCTPQQYLELRSIKAGNITDFARQAVDLFWEDERYPRFHEEQVLASAAGI